jgi:hypothetical protein
MVYQVTFNVETEREKGEIEELVRNYQMKKQEVKVEEKEEEEVKHRGRPKKK